MGRLSQTCHASFSSVMLGVRLYTSARPSVRLPSPEPYPPCRTHSVWLTTHDCSVSPRGRPPRSNNPISAQRTVCECRAGRHSSGLTHQREQHLGPPIEHGECAHGAIECSTHRSPARARVTHTAQSFTDNVQRTQQRIQGEVFMMR